MATTASSTTTSLRRLSKSWAHVAGVRADHPVEIVMDTSIVTFECWLFKTRSEGICTRDTVPRSAIHYIRHTRPDVLYSASADGNFCTSILAICVGGRLHRPDRRFASKHAETQRGPRRAERRTGPDVPAVLSTHHVEAVYLPTLQLRAPEAHPARHSPQKPRIGQTSVRRQHRHYYG